MGNNLSKLSVPLNLVSRKSGDKIITPYRNDFVHDRDRIMYCKAFRRLAGKTQVYRTGVDDHSRTRLTHTIEVTQISRTISYALNLNCDLSEAIALGHDVGHAPFGHAGERVLHQLMTPKLDKDLGTKKHIFEEFSEHDIDEYKEFFGYKHNLQSTRLCCEFGTHDGKVGLDLTNYTLWGIQNHSKLVYDSKRTNTFELLDFYKRYLLDLSIKEDINRQAWSYEAYVVSIADEIAQMHHDLEDALRCGAFERKDALRIVRDNLFAFMNAEDKDRFAKIKNENENSIFIDQLSKIVINTLVSVVILKSTLNLEYVAKNVESKGGNYEDFFTQSSVQDQLVCNAIGYVCFDDPKAKSKIQSFKVECSNKILNTADVHRSDSKGIYIIRKLFDAYYSNPQQLPDHVIEKFMLVKNYYKSKAILENVKKRNGMAVIRKTFMVNYGRKIEQNDKQICLLLMRLICDHISSMTDNYAISEYQELYS